MFVQVRVFWTNTQCLKKQTIILFLPKIMRVYYFQEKFICAVAEKPQTVFRPQKSDLEAL